MSFSGSSDSRWISCATIRLAISSFDRAAEEDDPLAEQPAVDVERALPAGVCSTHHRHQRHHALLVSRIYATDRLRVQTLADVQPCGLREAPPLRPRTRRGAAMPSVTRSITLDAAPEQVWEAITDEALLRDVARPRRSSSIRARRGEIVCRYEDGEERRGEVSLVEDGRAPRLHLAPRRRRREPGRARSPRPSPAARRLTVVETRRGAARASGRGRLEPAPREPAALPGEPCLRLAAAPAPTPSSTPSPSRRGGA